jgi:predicted nuclease with TOPRIM domain
MNTDDRKVLAEIEGLLEDAKERLECLQEDLEERAGNIPENFTDRIEQLENEASELSDAVSDLESCLEHITMASGE